MPAALCGGVAWGKGRPGLTAARLWGWGAGQAVLGLTKHQRQGRHPPTPPKPLVNYTLYSKKIAPGVTVNLTPSANFLKID